MEQHNTRAKITPGKIVFLPQKPEEEIHSDPVLRLAQNSRRIPPATFVPRRGSSIFRSCVLFLKKVAAALVSPGRKQPNLYEGLENTINEIEEGAQKLDEKLLTLKSRAESRHQVNNDKEQHRQTK